MPRSIRNRVGAAASSPAMRADAEAPETKAKAEQFEALVSHYLDQVLESIDTEQAASMDEKELTETVSQLLRRLELTPNAPGVGSQNMNLAVRLVDEMRGLGPLGPLMRDPEVSDILVNGLNSTYVERNGRLASEEVSFRDVEHITRIAQRIASGVGRRIDELNPMCDARLPDGSRVNIIAPPLAIDGAAISIRRFRAGGFTLEQLANNGAMHPNMARLLEAATAAQLNIVVSGGTGAGKTTILNALSGHIDPNERLVTLEDAAELNLLQPHVVRLETRASTSASTAGISMRDLLRNALRMRPDRIIVGEVRGGEALEALQAMNTGHPGSMFTVHANTPRDAVSRLEYLLMISSAELPSKVVRNQVVSAVDLIVQATRFRNGRRRITSITDVVGLEGDVPVLEDLWSYDAGQDSFQCNSSRPSFRERMEEMGFGEALADSLSSVRSMAWSD